MTGQGFMFSWVAGAKMAAFTMTEAADAMQTFSRFRLYHWLVALLFAAAYLTGEDAGLARLAGLWPAGLAGAAADAGAAGPDARFSAFVA